MDGQMRLFEGGTSGIFRFDVKFDIPGYNWLVLTFSDVSIIFHLKTIYLALFGVIICVTCVTVRLFLFHFDILY